MHIMAMKNKTTTSKSSSKKTSAPPTPHSPSTLIGIGMLLGAIVVTIMIITFHSPEARITNLSTTDKRHQALRNQLNKNIQPSEFKNIANEFSVELEKAKSEIKAGEALQIQMTKVNSKLEQQLKKEQEERAELAKELQVAAVEEERLKEKLNTATTILPDNAPIATTSTTTTTATTATTATAPTTASPNIPGSKSLEQMLTDHKKLQADMISGAIPMRAITFGAGGRSDVGGYGNRMIGMLSGMLIALYLDRAYYIDHSTGFKMTDYYDGVNHNIPWGTLLSDTKSIGTKVSIVDYQGKENGVRCASMFKSLDQQKSAKHIGFVTNQDCFLDIHMHYQSLKPGLLARRDGLTKIYNYLFEPSKTFAPVILTLTNHVRSAEEFADHSVQTVCTHIRTGKIKGGSDPARQGKSGGFVNFVKNKIAPCAKIVAKNTIGMSKVAQKTRYFVAADNDEALKVFKSSMGGGAEVVDGSTVPGLNNVMHLARSGGHVNKEGVTRMLADFEVFRRSCDYIILAPSTFSSLAYMTADSRGSRGVQGFLDKDGTCRSPWHFFCDSGYGAL